MHFLILNQGLLPLGDVLGNALFSLLAVLLLLALHLFNKDTFHSARIFSQFSESSLSFPIGFI